MGFAKRFTSLITKIVLGSAVFFVHKFKHEEPHVLLEELKAIDKKVHQKIINIQEAKKEFIYLLHKLKNTTQRLVEKGETFEAEHIYYIYEQYASTFKDTNLMKQIKTFY